MADIISGKSRFNGKGGSTPKKKVVPLNRNSEPYDALNEEQVRQRIKKHRRRNLLLIAGIIVLIGLATGLIILAMNNVTYSTYSISSSVNRDDTESASYTAFGDGYLRYSNDGIAYFDQKGNVIWDQTYSMQSPQLKICEDCAAVGDINGSQIYIFNEDGLLGSVDTSLSISQIEVASQGVVAAVLEDNNANYINMYDTDGSKIYTVKTTLSGDGYPIDISISEDATKLMASYIYVSGETIKTNVVFYNFSDVGENETERVVGGFNHYGSTLVGDVQFMNETTAVAVGEDVISIYKIKEYPSLEKEITIDQDIDRVFFSDKYIGLVLDNSDEGELYKLVVYDLSGNKVCETSFNTQYDDIKFDGKTILMNNATTITLMNLKGKVLTNQTVELPIDSLLSTGTRGNYLMVNSKYIQNIRLR